jgi:hypothetical protein
MLLEFVMFWDKFNGKHQQITWNCCSYISSSDCTLKKKASESNKTLLLLTRIHTVTSQKTKSKSKYSLPTEASNFTVLNRVFFVTRLLTLEQMSLLMGSDRWCCLLCSVHYSYKKLSHYKKSIVRNKDTEK